MKKLLLFFTIFTTVNCAFAQLNTDGNGYYYRVQNSVTKRYIRIIDNKGDVSTSTTEVDLNALETIKNFDEVVSDPATIVYISVKKTGTSTIWEVKEMAAQGTKVDNIFKYDNAQVSVLDNKNGTYRVYGKYSGMTKYLCDENTNFPFGAVVTSGNNTRNWYIKPVNQEEEQYFALTPTVTAEGNHYSTIYAAFPFTLPAGMTAYYVSIVDGNQAVWKEVKDGKVPASTPVYVKCKSENYADNKVVLGSNGASSLSGNLLKGVYFCNDTEDYHRNILAYNPKTMRVLGTMSNGKLGFITDDELDFIPANTVYLTVPANSPREIKLVSESEYDTAIDDVIDDTNLSYKLYNLQGVELEQPQKGINIMLFENGTAKKVMVK